MGGDLFSPMFPRPVAGASVPLGLTDYPTLPEEWALIERAVPKRRVEFSAGRHCARAAMRSLGYPDTAILAGRDRAPIWPDGLTGSITHCRGFAAAVVAPLHRFLAVGIDAERSAEVPLSLTDTVLRPDERVEGPWQACNDQPQMLTLFFCVKEASYKAYYQMTGELISFQHMHITLAPDARSFIADVKVGSDRKPPPTAMRLRGRCEVAEDLTCAAAWQLA
jgi:4'-phosphopantetheinyl transferase EntD